MIPTEIIEDIRNQVNIQDIVSEVIQLKRAGSNFMGLCPFHNEKSPSFSVSPEKQLYYCFGCGEGGTSYNFLMKYYGLTFMEAVERLAALANIDLSPYQGRDASNYEAKKKHRTECKKLLNFAMECFFKSLQKSPKAQIARDYLQQRKISPQTFEKWCLGYAPAGGKQLLEVIKKKGFSVDVALDVGLVRKDRQGNAYDYFRNRLMFPIFDPEGQVVAFGGRALSNEDMPKYINSPETLVFDKSETLFGIDKAMVAFREQKSAILAEGYTDVMALHEAGFNNAVASLGTALTAKHIKKLKRYVSKLTLIYDGDSAGQNAAFRAMAPILGQGLSSKVLILQENMDPDDFLQKQGSKKLGELLNEAPPILDFFVQKFYFNERDLGKKAEFIGFLANIIGQMKDVFAKEALIDEVCRMTGVEKSSLSAKQGQSNLIPKRAAQESDANKTEEKIPVALSKEELILLRLLFECPDMKMKFYEIPQQMFSKAFLHQLKRFKNEENQLDKQRFIHDLSSSLSDEQFKSEMTRVFMDVSLDMAQDQEKIMTDCLQKLAKRTVHKLSKRLIELDSQEDSKQINEIFSEIRSLKSRDWMSYVH